MPCCFDALSGLTLTNPRIKAMMDVCVHEDMHAPTITTHSAHTLLSFLSCRCGYAPDVRSTCVLSLLLSALSPLSAPNREGRLRYLLHERLFYIRSPFLPPSFYVSIFLALVALFLSLSVTLSLPLSLSLCPSVSISVFASIPVSVSFNVDVSASVSVSVDVFPV